MRLSALSYQLTVFGLTALLMACSEASTQDEFEPSEVHSDVMMPESFTDPQGKTWVLTQSKVEYSNDEGPIADNSEQPVPIADMTFDDLVEAVRPVTLAGDREYTLVDEDARAFAQQILLSLQNERDESAPAALGNDETGDLSEDPLALIGTPISQDGTKKATIFGSNSWSDITASWGQFPQNLVAIMNTATNLSGSGCTAFKLINHYTAVTAAHCLHNGSSWLTRKNIKFGGNNWTGSGCWQATVPGCWDGDATDCDYGIIQLRGRGGDATCDESTYDVGYFGYKTVNAGTNNVHAWLMGFPGQYLPAGWPYGTLTYEYRTDNWVPVFDYNQFRTTLDAGNGLSGAPYAAYYDDGGYKAKAIHNYSSSDYNFGRAFKSSLIDWFQGLSGY